MGEAAFEEEAPFLDQPLKAAAVMCRTEHGGLHTGVLYRESESESAVLHLAWEDRLEIKWEGHNGPWDRLWAAPRVEPERLMAIAGRCRQIRKRVQKRGGKMRYAMRFSQSTFSHTGELLLGEGAKGLTCSTFVLAVFNSMGIKLVDEATWPVRKEADQAYIDSVRRFATPANLALLQSEVDSGVKRIQPAEVIGACAYPPSASFEQAQEGAQRALAKLDG